MPLLPSRPCNHSGCRELVSGDSLCPKHKQQAQIRNMHASHANAKLAQQLDQGLAMSAKIHSSSQWRVVSKQVLALQPLCYDPFKIHLTKPSLAVHSHHVEPLRYRPDLAFDMDNLRGLCIRCHSKIEALERRKKPTAYLFKDIPVATFDDYPFVTGSVSVAFK